MYFKNCPICNSVVDYTYDSGKSLYIMHCPKCQEKGLTIKIEHSDINYIQKVWNDREFDNILLEDPEFSIKLLSFYNGTLKIPSDIHMLKNDTTHQGFESFSSSENIFGYLITLNGEVIICNKEHCEELMKYLGFDVSNIELSNDDIMKVAINYGFIRISVQSKCLMIDLVPMKVDKKQITCLIDFLVENVDKLKCIQTFCVYTNNGVQKEDINVFNTLNDVILYLDKVK